ncbi:MAG: hypothetical protein NTY19_16840 [Planctomycetota bacterium]|nr:hypothetical protein [Planctomycetota bacterium]
MTEKTKRANSAISRGLNMNGNRHGQQTRDVFLAAAAILTMASLGTAAVPPPLKALHDKTLVA